MRRPGFRLSRAKLALAAQFARENRKLHSVIHAPIVPTSWQMVRLDLKPMLRAHCRNAESVFSGCQ